MIPAAWGRQCPVRVPFASFASFASFAVHWRFVYHS
jgi:hypothetical protein